MKRRTLGSIYPDDLDALGRHLDAIRRTNVGHRLRDLRGGSAAARGR